MTSKFFRDAASSESETESENEEEIPVRAAPTSKPVSFLPSDDEEDQKRVVRTAKDKRFSELKDLIKQLRNSKKIKDISKVLSIFEDLGAAYQKAKNVIDKEGGIAPRFYLRYLAELEDFIVSNWEDKESKKNLSKNNAKSLSTLRQKSRKYVRDFETEIESYRQSPDPEGYSSDEVEESDEDEDEPEAIVVPEKKAISTKSRRKSDDEESDWEMSSSSDEGEDDLGGKTMEEMRKFFLKSTTTKPKEKEKRKARVDRDRKEVDEDKDDEAGWKAVAGAQVKIEMFPKDAEITGEMVVKKMNEIFAARGRKGTDRKELTDLLKELHAIALSNNMPTALCIKILFGVIASIFDYNPKYFDCLPYASWKNSYDVINTVLQLLKTNPEIKCSADIPEEAENLLDDSRLFQIQACILTMFERLDEEFTKVLQEADCHSTDYVEKLKAERDICSLIEDILAHLENIQVSDPELCRIYMRRIEHTYYKLDTTDSGSKELMDKLCKLVYAKDDKRLRARSMLCHIYHHALHDRWYDARDLIMISHLQATIDSSDIATQILYNRTICQFGLCAFRNGCVQEAFSALADFQGGGKIKELLAQGLSMLPKGQERSPEQEKLERQRQLPYHMHINLDLLESVYLISAMLLEIPQMAAKELDSGRRGFRISRSFHYQLKQSERQSLIGQPENTREHVVAASRALLRGDWRQCRDYVINDKMNARVWNLFINGDKVKCMLIRRIQEEALRTYLFTYSSIYDSISLVKLSEMFDLDKKCVHAIVSKMIIQEDLSASLDEPAELVVIHRIEPTKLQTLSLQLTDKLKVLAENLDQVLEPRTATGFAYNKQNWYGQRQQGGQQMDGGRRQQQQQQMKNY